MPGGGGRAAEEEGAAALSPKSRLKFLCSCGGKILPRPTDGQLKYVGGETRVVCVPRSVTFRELKEKIDGMFSSPEFVIKYQCFPEDLDALVSVRSDEDLRHMVEEYNRYESLPRSPSSSPRFRIFLFPPPSAFRTPSSTSPTYIDAVNGSAFTPRSGTSIPVPARPAIFTMNTSPPSAPPSVDSSPSTVRPGQPRMQRVNSTPNLSSALSNMASNVLMTPQGSQHSHHHHQPQLQPQPQTQSQQHKGVMGHAAGAGAMSRMGGSSHWQEACGWGCACHQNQRRHFLLPSGLASPNGCRGGHLEELHSSASSSANSSFNGNFSLTSAVGTPPVAPKQNFW